MSGPARLTEVRLGHAANCSALGNVVNALVWSQVVAGAVWAAAEAWQARRRRTEPGGESRLTEDPSALLRYSDADEPVDHPPREAHLQITEACGLPCVSCHMPTTASGRHVPLAALTHRLDQLAGDGILRVALGGGEPLRHPDLAAIAEHARALGLAIGVTTSGVGPHRTLAAFDQVNVSIDGLGEDFVRSRGYDGADAALATVTALTSEGPVIGVNIVLDRHNFDSVEATVHAAIAAGATDIQLLRLKPVGRALNDYHARRLTPAQALAVWPLAQRLMARHPGVTVRLDCASIPYIAAHADSATTGPLLARMRAFGFRGCFGAAELVSVDVHGARHPCSFAPSLATTSATSTQETTAWRAGVLSGPCGTCPFQPVCKGGCHAVSGAHGGDRFAPDPECPRVLAAMDAAAGTTL